MHTERPRLTVGAFRNDQPPPRTSRRPGRPRSRVPPEQGGNLLQSILGNEGFVLKISATQKASGPNGSRENPLGAVRFVGRLRSHLKRLADPLGQFPMIGRRGGQGAVTCPKHVLLGLGGRQGRFAPFHQGLIPSGATWSRISRAVAQMNPDKKARRVQSGDTSSALHNR